MENKNRKSSFSETISLLFYYGLIAGIFFSFAAIHPLCLIIVVVYFISIFLGDD